MVYSDHYLKRNTSSLFTGRGSKKRIVMLICPRRVELSQSSYLIGLTIATLIPTDHCSTPPASSPLVLSALYFQKQLLVNAYECNVRTAKLCIV